MPCINFGEVLHNVSYLRYTSGIHIALEAMLLNLHAKLAPGWALIRVNFDPIQEAKSRKWALFREYALFRKTTVITSWIVDWAGGLIPLTLKVLFQLVGLHLVLIMCILQPCQKVGLDAFTKKTGAS